MMNSFILTEDFISKLVRLSVATSSKLRGQHKGSHRSHRFGSSLDFSDYREYAMGDDVRQVDWNVYARTEKYFIKRFLDEQEMRVHILLDSSRSMGEEKKWLFARQIASALGFMVLNRDDRLSFSALEEEIIFRKKGAAYRKAFLQMVANMPDASFKGSFARNGIKVLPKDCTVLFVVTDGLEPLGEWEHFFRKLPHFSGDVRCIQIVTEEELHPPYTGDIRLIDVESDEELNVSMSNKVLEDYQKGREQHEKAFHAICSRFGIKTIQLVADDGIERAVFHHLLKNRWIQ
ncbi:DUF58 domain-containing protein [Ureibacillus terrenus]|uniref:DUF58 domain-containing protein n=1 Tax=Ureibacillus terrenus TaxID=118246 RepID=UPI002E2201E0|nr:DUF58 domain-containing protein [Ureibacillus terrenus]